MIKIWELSFLFSTPLRRLLDSLTTGQAWAFRVGASSPGHRTTREFLGPGNINQHVFSQRCPCWHQDLALHNCLQAPVLETSCQTTSKMGSQNYPSSNMLPKSHLACRHPKTPHNVTLIIRVKSQLHTPKHRHQSLPPGRLRKSLDQLHPPGHRQQKQEELWLCMLWKGGDHRHSNLDKMRWQRSSLQMKKQG